MTPGLRLSFALITFIAIGTIAAGQSVAVSVGSASTTAGGTVTIPITMVPSGGAQVAGLQWSLNGSSGIASVTFASGNAASSAGKTIACQTATCLVYGLSQTSIANGSVALVTIQVAPNALPSAISVQLSGLVVASPQGNSIPVTASGGTVTVTAPTPVIRLNSLTCAAAALTLNSSTACTVSVDGTSANPLSVALTSSQTGLAVPNVVAIPAGQTSATFQASSGTITGSISAIVTATLNGSSLSVTLVVSAPIPTADSVTPSGGAGMGATFSFVFSDSQNVANLSAAAILFAPSLTYTNACFIIYDRARATIQLQWDNANGNSVKAIASPLQLQNSQCSVGAASVTTSGLSLTLSVDITFKSSFGGTKNIYMYGANGDGRINTGWVQKGTYSISMGLVPTPSVDSVTPNSTSGYRQTFSFVFSDTLNADNLSATAVLFATSVQYPNTCFLIYDRSRATIQLQWDNANGNMSRPIPSTNVLENSQCRIGPASVTSSGLSLTLTVEVTFKSAFSGSKNIYMYAAVGNGSINTGWVQKGTYTVSLGPPVPSVESVNPSGGTGSRQIFTFVFSDSQSASNLSAAAILFGASLTYPDSCFMIYDRNQGTIQLQWDNMAGAHAKPINSTTTLQNSQCTVGTTSLAVSALSNTITVDVTFKNTFSGLKNIYMYGAVTDGTINTGWIQKGTWTP